MRAGHLAGDMRGHLLEPFEYHDGVFVTKLRHLVLWRVFRRTAGITWDKSTEAIARAAHTAVHLHRVAYLHPPPRNR